LNSVRPFLAYSSLIVLLCAFPLFAQDALRPRDTPAELVAFIDAEFASQWRAKKLQPSPTCTDQEFVRRAYLDINGTIPGAAQARAFAKDARPDKRALLVNRLIRSPAHAQYESMQWGNILVGRGTKAKALEQLTLRNWLREQFAANAPFDRIARALLTATGNSRQNPPAQWTLHHKQKPENLASAASRIFLGTQIQCAQCHDHPFDTWEQRDFYGLAAFFARIEEQQRLFGRTVQETKTGEIRLGGLPDGDVIPPTFPWGEDTVNPRESPRAALADWLRSPQNTQFAKAITNPMWAHYLGRGFVNPIDDFCDANTPVYPKVLDRLARYFTDSGYDLRALGRVITATRAYQLSSRATRSNATDSRYFSKMPLRRLSAEQLLAGVVTSTGISSNIADNPLFKLLLGGVQQDFVFVFANMDEMTEVTEFQGTIAQALLMMNSQHIARIVDFKFLDPLTRILFPLSPAAQIDQLYWHTLSRAPSDAERTNFLSYYEGVKQPQKRLEICEDIYWALLNSAEFAFNY
jgi:hypothetical protein